MITFEDFKDNILKDVENCPKVWRRGQCVFNIVDEIGLARIVQFQDGIDCFYNDDAIDDFLIHAYYYYVEYQKNKNDETVERKN